MDEELSEELFELYRKLECLIYRYLKMAEFIESNLKFLIKLKPSIEEVLSEKGYENGDGFYIPFNPFYLNKEHQQIFENMYPNPIMFDKSSDNSKREALIECWNRINEIKQFVGVTEHTQYCGQPNKRNRLLHILETYKRSGILSTDFGFTRTIFSKAGDRDIDRMINILRDRRKKDGVKSIVANARHNKKNSFNKKTTKPYTRRS